MARRLLASYTSSDKPVKSSVCMVVGVGLCNQLRASDSSNSWLVHANLNEARHANKAEVQKVDAQVPATDDVAGVPAAADLEDAFGLTSPFAAAAVVTITGLGKLLTCTVPAVVTFAAVTFV